MRPGTSCAGEGCRPKARSPPSRTRPCGALLTHVKANNIRIHSESELLEHLLGILGSVTPVDQWPSQAKKKAGKKQRVAQAREITRARAAAADRPAAPAAADEQVPAEMPAAWAEHARTIDRAVDTDRRRRREEALMRHQARRSGDAARGPEPAPHVQTSSS